MEKLTRIGTRSFAVLYALVDLMCVGAGMGVPIFCILLGFPLGWYITRRSFVSEGHSRLLYTKILRSSILAAAFTFLSMAVIWGIGVVMFLHSSGDVRNFGHPFILFDPKASFIGWLVLMIVVSPFLQLLTTIFASFLALTRVESENRDCV